MKKLVVLATMLAIVLVGCGEGSRYGSREIGDFKTKPQGDLGATTTVAPPPADAAAAEPADTTTTTRPTTTTTAKRAPEGYPIKIQADQAGTQFEPRVAQVFVGTPITWTNTDSQPRSVEFSDQSYVSGPIPPGGSVTFVANRAGEFNYSDGTRPYAVGTLRVQSR